VSTQRLPLPIGSPNAVRAPGRTWRGGAAVSGRAMLGLLGVLAAGAGAYLGSTPPPVTVSVDAAAYHLGTVSFPARGAGVYAGPHGAVVIIDSGSVTRSSASTRLNGVSMLGSCTIDHRAAVESCRFTLDGRAVAAEDRLDAGGWQRSYEDGRTVRIRLAGGRPVPVPFALGR
jgi:hypothetical protein